MRDRIENFAYNFSAAPTPWRKPSLHMLSPFTYIWYIRLLADYFAWREIKMARIIMIFTHCQRINYCLYYRISFAIYDAYRQEAALTITIIDWPRFDFGQSAFSEMISLRRGATHFFHRDDFRCNIDVWFDEWVKRHASSIWEIFDDHAYAFRCFFAPRE